jgi:hypothetical protein
MKRSFKEILADAKRDVQEKVTQPVAEPPEMRPSVPRAETERDNEELLGTIHNLLKQRLADARSDETVEVLEGLLDLLETETFEPIETTGPQHVVLKDRLGNVGNLWIVGGRLKLNDVVLRRKGVEELRSRLTHFLNAGYFSYRSPEDEDVPVGNDLNMPDDIYRSLQPHFTGDEQMRAWWNSPNEIFEGRRPFQVSDDRLRTYIRERFGEQ